MMESKQKIKVALQKITKAELEEALVILRDLISYIGDVPKVDIIIRCCSLCTSNISSPDNISEVFLYQILMLVVPSIESIDETSLLSFIQSMYHIVKFLVVKGSFGITAKLEDTVFPKILPPPSQVSEKHHHVYYALAQFILKTLQDTEAQDETLLSLCQLTFKSCFYTTDLVQAFSIVNAYINMKMQNDTRKMVYGNFLDSIRFRALPTGCEEPFRYISHILYSVLCSFATSHDFIGLKYFYTDAVQKGNMSFKHKEYEHLHNCILHFPLLLANVDQKCTISDIECCKNSLQSLDLMIKSQKVRGALSYMLDCLMEDVGKYQKVANTWCKLDEEFQLACFDYIYDLSVFESKLDKECSCKCNSKQIYQAISYVRFITAFARSYILTAKSTTGYHKRCCQILEQFFSYIVQLKENNCKKLGSSWGYLVVGAYNVAVKLNEVSNKDALIYFKFVIDKYYLFGNKFSPSSLTYALHGVCKLLSDEHQQLLALSALAMCLSPNDSDIYLSIFTKAKYTMSNNTDSKKDVKEITLVSVFSDLKHHFSFLSKPVEMSKEKQITLLKAELEYYKKKWKSKVSVMTVLTELIAITDLEVIVDIMVDIFGDGEITVHEKLPGIFSEILLKYEKLKDANKYNLAILNYMNYRYKNQEARTRNIAEMERVVNFLTKTKSEPSGPDKPDPNEECDIVSGFDGLKLDNFINQLKFLDKSLELLTEIRHTITSGAFDALLRIYYEYRLHQSKIPALRALELALEQAEMSKDQENLVTVISFMLEETDASRKFVKHLMVQADQYLSKLDQDDISNVKAITMYYLNRSKAHLYIDYEQTVKYYKKAKTILKKWDSIDFNILRCHFNMLGHKIILLPCNQKNRSDHETLSLLNMEVAISTLFDEYGERRLQGSYGMLLLFEFSEEVAKFYYSVRCPREVRAHCKEVIHLAQKLVLPLRSASLLQYLAYADLRTNRIDDAQYKLNSMAEILCLNKTKILEITEPTAKTDIESEVGSVTDYMREMVLDEPVKRGRSQGAPLSPIFDTQPFQTPSFVHHPKSCICIFCSCLQYQILVLEKARLDALIHIKRGNFSVANDVLANALHFYDSCDTKYRYLQDTLGNILNKDLVPKFDDVSLQTYGGVLLDYSYHLRRIENKEKATDTNLKLLQILLPKKSEYVYLHHEAAMQRLGYLTEVPEVVSPVEDDDELEDYATGYLQKTPEDHRAKVVFVVSPDPTADELEPPKPIFKKVPFPLSPSPDRRPETPIVKKATFAKTPTAKIPIFKDTCSTTKRSTRKRLDAASSSADLMKPPSSTSELNLKSKTKLLTEKLKNSSKKVQEPTVGSTSGQSTSSVGGLARKKLFSDESTKETADEPPALRRSHRSRKNK
ncbi:unnamed protein product [Acanthoscelides obtectus]|uniref:Uncharacterized protein n=2 Tax=Acanthoscelides obtectus TaxID=200917 RepID=A0A9P0JS21_ACAOB|nr:unnamed protein product [Acanthoscelides obtectus]CAK1663775.1 hypothetical protein AOBTE_LOCUS23847 [Acanthoscelides obtectus]